MKKPIRTFLDGLIRVGGSILCRLDKDALNAVPHKGPLIIAANHINSLEVPLMFAFLRKHNLYCVAKVETWDSKFMGWLFDLWEAIPIRRGELDLEAVRRSLGVLQDGNLLVVAPEGTRSRHGRLLRAEPGIALLALRSGAPVLPVAHWGGENFSTNFKHFKRTDFHVRVGKPFTLDPGNQKVTGEVRQAMADEVMYQIAAMMPEEYRGEYMDMTRATKKYLKFAS